MSYTEISPAYFFLSLFIATLSSIFAYQKAKKYGLSPLFWACLCFLASLPGLLMLWGVIYFKTNFASPASEKPNPMTYNQEGRGYPVQNTNLNHGADTKNALLWHYVDEVKKEKKGPFLVDELKKLYEKRVIQPETYLWSKGMKNWEKLDSLPEIHKELKKI